jgi:hypothetical protein
VRDKVHDFSLILAVRLTGIGSGKEDPESCFLKFPTYFMIQRWN